MDWLKYKSGTDIRFDAVETPENEKNIDDSTITAIVKAFAYLLSARLSKDELTIAVGHDSRISSPNIRTLAVEALKSSGCKVFDCGLMSTPSMFFLTKHQRTNADGAIMITASHHPFQKNGLKFFSKSGGLESEDITTLLEHAALSRQLKPKTITSQKRASVERGDYLKLYCDSLVDMIRHETGDMYPLKDFRIVLDAGNGSGGFFVDRILTVLGADTTGSQFLEPDGTFPNHIPNPENAKAMKAISDCVLANKADLGIIFDTDVDRAACVLSDGSEINRNRLIALVSAIVLEEFPGATIVTDSVTSDGLTEFITKKNGDHHRFKRGYKNVINEAIDLINNGIHAPLAIETSGHAAFESNDFLDDGAYLVTKILIKMCQLKKHGKELLNLIEDLKEPLETKELRIGFFAEDWKSAGSRALERLEKQARKTRGWTVVPKTYEGIRVSTKIGFFLVRMSVHDPVIPINFEANVERGNQKMAAKLYKKLKRNRDLDLTALKKFIGKQ